MRGDVKILAGLLAAGWIGLASTAASAAWKYGEDSRGHPELQYLENGKATFYIGCGRAFGLHVHYPGKAGKSQRPASITISAGKASMVFKGEFQETTEDMATEFLQWDLGYRRQDPALFGKRWKAKLTRLLDLLGSGKPLKVSAGKDSFQLPPNDAKGWREPFDGCG